MVLVNGRRLTVRGRERTLVVDSIFIATGRIGLSDTPSLLAGIAMLELAACTLYMGYSLRKRYTALSDKYPGMIGAARRFKSESRTEA